MKVTNPALLITAYSAQDSVTSSMVSLPSPQQPLMSQPSPSPQIPMQHSPMPQMPQGQPQPQQQAQPIVSQPQMTNQMPPQSQYEQMKMVCSYFVLGVFEIFIWGNFSLIHVIHVYVFTVIYSKAYISNNLF